MNLDEHFLQAMITQVIDSKKYRHTGLNPATVEDLIRQEAPHHTSQKALLKAVRRKLHNIVAPYLGTLDYETLTEELLKIEETSPLSEPLQSFCLDVLAKHVSTAERIPLLPTFYTHLFAMTGQPQVILDLACGLHPLAFPWMGLPTTVNYHAYDILQPRVDFINHFFTKVGLAPLAENRDILVDPPTQPADVAFFFKEAHRFEKRQPGCNRAFWESLQVDFLAVSLPSHNLAGTHSMQAGNRKLIHDNLPDNSRVHELTFENEIIFLIERNKAG